jgi:DDE superfamily endonuclease
VDHRRQSPSRAASSGASAVGFKKNSAGILPQFEQLWNECLPAFDQRRVADRAQTLALSSLLCLGRHTVTGLLTTSGSQFQDWSATYRLFSQERLPLPEIFSVVRRAGAGQLPAGAPFRAVLDDSLLRRSGLHTPGVGWRRDPLGPRFQTNFVRAQRFLQVSAAMPGRDGVYRLAPIAFLHTPTPHKPNRKASAADLAQYRLEASASRLSLRAAQQMIQLRQSLDQDTGGKQRTLLLAFDGGYTNSTVLKQIPPHTTCIGRIRKDANLCFTPDPAQIKARGRPLRYGAQAPTPEQFRSDDSEPWQTMSFLHSGVAHELRFKRRQNIMWRTAGVQQILQLVIIAPLAYRPRKGSKLLYRDPAYLICTDPALEPRQIIEAYFQRWDIEVNFRDEKTFLGVGQAQVRAEASVESAPALTVAAYGMLLVSAQRAFGNSDDGLLPQPKWAASSKGPRTSTQQLLHQLRAEVWGRGLGLESFSGFASNLPTDTKPEKCTFPLASAVCYANG